MTDIRLRPLPTDVRAQRRGGGRGNYTGTRITLTALVAGCTLLPLQSKVSGYEQLLGRDGTVEELQLEVCFARSPAEPRRAMEEVERLYIGLQAAVECKTLRLTLDLGEGLESNHRTRRAIHRLESELLLPLHEQFPIQSVHLAQG